MQPLGWTETPVQDSPVEEECGGDVKGFGGGVGLEVMIWSQKKTCRGENGKAKQTKWNMPRWLRHFPVCEPGGVSAFSCPMEASFRDFASGFFEI